ncbi:MAG TPA: right-handed parallel beta-helix repeat-containing protein [Acidobacteriota bacterium]|nr:right-handed parallel beta-helix repeat-containing protein [Acidobacteriota bacterium]
MPATRRRKARLAWLVILVATAYSHSAAGLEARRDTISVGPGESVQAAIDAAIDGDVIELAAGEYTERIDFRGKEIRVVGVGDATVIRGMGRGPVVRFSNREGPGSVLDSVVITGGIAKRGGGIYIRNASPTVVRTLVARNRAESQGSAIYIGGKANPLIYNNLIIYNTNNGRGDPHAVEIVGASPWVINNTIARSDSNGLISRGGAPIIRNNLLAWNGTQVGGNRRGRGICDFSDRLASIHYNGFHRNTIAAILRDGRDWKKVRHLQNQRPDERVQCNIDGNPRFARRPPANADSASYGDFELAGAGKALDRGDPIAACNDHDGTRNDLGFTGGPFAAGTAEIPTAGACGTGPS